MTKLYPALLILGIWLVFLASPKANLTPADSRLTYDRDEAERAFWEQLQSLRPGCR